MVLGNRNIQTTLEEQGFAVVEDIYSTSQLAVIKKLLRKPAGGNEKFRGKEELFAIRGVMQEIPGLQQHLLNTSFKSILLNLFKSPPVCLKSIYFDKPEGSNWFVPWHHDMTINVKKRKEAEGFGPWTFRQGIHSVQPPVHVLEEIVTLRIHLDDTDETNGALRVIPCSHRLGILSREELKKVTTNNEYVTCNVKAGGIMLMKPLLLHSSSRSTGERPRRVLHLEFSDYRLNDLEWLESTGI